MSFVHLHNHTHYSLLDGACRVKDLIKAAKDMNMPAVAITDHGNMFGLMQFYGEAMKQGVKPIIGFEAYVAPKSRLDKQQTKGTDNAYHLILLARNNEGYKNLMKLSSLGYLEGFYYKPRIDRELLEKHHEGLVVLSSCIKGEIPRRLLNGDLEGARKTTAFFRDLFEEHFYLEIQDHGIPEETTAIQGLIQLSKEFDIPLVATNDTHYLKREHAAAQDILLCIQTGKDREDPNRLRFQTDQLYFKSPDEMKDLFSYAPEAITNSLVIAEKCGVSFDEEPHYPRFEIPENADSYTLDEYLDKKAHQGLRRRFPEPGPELIKRLDFELSVIKRMGFSGYFLIIADFIEYAKTNRIPVGPGRGSAAGSLAAYSLDITEVDPMRYGLLFERFLNPERISMPDIDIDFCYERREEIIRYVRQKYGERNVSQIITFGSMNARAVIRDVGRVMKIAYGEVDQIAKMIPFQKDLEETLETVPDFKKLTGSNPVYTEMIEHAKVLEGLARHASIHAAGVVIAPGDLTDFVPLFKSTQGDIITTQFDMKSLEKAGLLKMDFLGLRTLTVIDYALKALKTRGIEIDINAIPLDDPEAYRIFANGETVGIFQFESSGMREYLKKLQPTSIEDLTAMNALYRPGPMENIDDFINRKHGRVPVKYLHPLLEPILKETQGIIVYQEQVMKIVSDLGGFTLGKADILRKAMGKKNIEMLQQQKAAFEEGAKKNGIELKTARELFDLIEKFAGYGFNKSHAVCYSVVAYQTAYLKAHHPHEFMAANLTSELGDTDRIVTLIGECERMGIPVLPPDVNQGEWGFVAVEKGIQFGLGAVKNVGRSAVESIVATREKGGPFRTIFEFCERINLRLANRKVLESLIQSGATDTLEGSRAQKMAALNKAIQRMSSQSKVHAAQSTIFEDDETVGIVYPPLDLIEPWPLAEKLHREKEMLGFYISGHPLKKFEDDLTAFCKSLNRLSDLQAGQSVRVGGMIEDVKTTLDRKQKTMAFFTMEDLAGSVRVVVFADTYEKYKAVIQKENMVLVVGKADRRDEEEINILANEVIPLEEARSRFSQRLVVRLLSEQVQNGISDRMQFLFRRHSGTCPLVFHVTNEGRPPCLLHSKKFKINPLPELVHDLRAIVGDGNVWIE